MLFLLRELFQGHACFMATQVRVVCKLLASRRHHHRGYNLSRCVIYLPRPFSPPFLSERGLCSAAEPYLPSSQRRRERHGNGNVEHDCEKYQRSSGMPPLRLDANEREGWKRHRYEYSSRVGNVVRCILTNQGVNMTLAQKPTVRERN